MCGTCMWCMLHFWLWLLRWKYEKSACPSGYTLHKVGTWVDGEWKMQHGVKYLDMITKGYIIRVHCTPVHDMYVYNRTYIHVYMSLWVHTYTYVVHTYQKWGGRMYMYMWCIVCAFHTLLKSVTCTKMKMVDCDSILGYLYPCVCA